MNKYSTLLIISFFLLFSCNKEKVIDTPTQVGISKVTFFPVLTLKGDNIIAIENGTTFTDPGATAKAGETEVPVTISGTVNTNQNGVYTLTYTAVNSDGFSASIIRTVAVFKTAADAAAHNLSGDYIRGATGTITTWERLAPGVYLVTNPGGAVSGAALTVIAFNPADFTISVPLQRSSDGNISSASSITYTNSNPPMYTWVFNNPGYGTALRTFVKQ